MTKRFLVILATLLVAVFVLGACATTTDTPPAADTPPPATVDTPPPTPPAVTPPTQDVTLERQHRDFPAIPASSQPHLIIAVQSLAVSMDPIQRNDSASALNNNMLFSTLVDMDEDTFEVLPALAVAWEMLDAATVQMELRQGVTFHNGDRLTAHDVQFSLERAGVSPEVEPIVGMIDYVTVIDDYNFILHLEYAFAPILRHLAHTAVGIVPRDHMLAVGEDAFAEHPIGTGAFAFDHQVIGDSVHMVRNDSYWGSVPSIQTLTFRNIPDQQGRLIAVETGEVHVADAIAPIDFARAEATPGVNALRRMNLSTNYVGFNTRQPYLDNPLVRQAINYMIDGAAIVEHVLMGFGAPANGPIANIVWGYYPVAPFTVNFDRAQELMIEAGLEDGFSTTIWYNIPNFEHDMFLLGWVSVVGDLDYALHPLFHSDHFGPGGNRFGLASDRLDDLLDRARVETNPATRSQLYADAMILLDEYLPMALLNQGENLVLRHNSVGGFVINPAGHFNFANVYFYAD
jgi:peptide/nickel transport system substrate-binding protein